MRVLTVGLVLAMAAGASGCGSKFRSYNGPEVTRVEVHKQSRRMYLLHGSEILKEYKIGLGGNPVGPKKVEGDGKTPEGYYTIDRRNPNSAYHLSLGISYPSEADVAEAKALGEEPGGDIFIHGQARQNRGKGKDWTAGCIAVRDGQMEEVYSMVRTGTPILIVP